MNKTKLSRRAVLTLGSAAAGFCVLGALPINAAEPDGGACTDPDKLRRADKSLRDSMEYTAKSSDELKNCATCAFFQFDGDEPQCGSCAILNGTVEAKGHCVSWSPKG
jgi:hypothetical protein